MGPGTILMVVLGFAAWASLMSANDNTRNTLRADILHLTREESTPVITADDYHLAIKQRDEARAMLEERGEKCSYCG